MTNTKRNLFYLMGLSLIAYPLGLVNQMLMSYYFGTSAEIDAYWIAMTIVNMLGFYIHPAREALVPGFFKRRQENKFSGNQYFSEVSNFLLIIVFISSVLLLLSPDFFTGFVVSDQQFYLRSKVSRLLPYVVPLVFLLASTEILNGILISYNKVIFQNIGRIIGVLSSIIFLVLFAKQWQIKAVIFGAVLAQVILFVIQGRELRKQGLQYNLLNKPRTDSKFRRMAGVLLLTYAFSQFYIIVERKVFTFFGEGIVSAYQYAQTLNQIPQSIFVMTLSIVLWPRFLELAQQQDRDQLYSVTFVACKRLLLVLSFITVFSWVFAKDIVYLLFYRGAFNEESLRVVTMCFRALILSACPLGVSMLISRALVSLQLPKALAFVGAGNAVAGLMVLWAGRWLGILEISIFHYSVSACVGCFISLFVFLKITKKRDLYRKKSIIKPVLWCGRLFILLIGLYLICSKFHFGVINNVTINKADLIFRLSGNVILLLSIFIVGVVSIRLISFSEILALLKLGHYSLYKKQSDK